MAKEHVVVVFAFLSDVKTGVWVLPVLLNEERERHRFYENLRRIDGHFFRF